MARLFYLPLVGLLVLSIINFLVLHLQKDAQERSLMETKGFIKGITFESDFLFTQLETQVVSTSRLEIQQKFDMFNRTFTQIEEKFEKRTRLQDVNLEEVSKTTYRYNEAIELKYQSNIAQSEKAAEMISRITSKLETVEKIVDKPFLVSQPRRNLKFVKRVVDQEGNVEKPDASQIQYYDLSKANITEDSLRLELMQQTLEKVAKKNEHLVKEVTELREIMAIMSTSVQVFSILKQFGFITESKPINFQKIHSMIKLEEYLKSFVRDTNVRGAEEAIHKSLAKNYLTDFEGNPIPIEEGITTGSNWSSMPFNIAKGGRNKSFLSGDVTIFGNDEFIMRALHRSLRIPVLLKRYTSRIHQALYKSNDVESLEGMEKATIFLVFGTVESSLPSSCLNRILTPKDILKISEYLIEKIEGNVYFPTDEELVSFIHKDPSQEAYGAWRMLLETEFNGVVMNRYRGEAKSTFTLALLLRMAAIHKFDLLIGTAVNQLQ